jgi:hypothetical protein
MKTKKKLFMMAMVFVLFGINKGISQNNTYVVNTTNQPGTNYDGTTSVGVGAQAGGLNCSFFGHLAGKNNGRTSNTAFGFGALSSNAPFTTTAGGFNSAFGSTTMQNNTSGQFNCSFGALSLRLNTTGKNNVAVGYKALEANTTGIDNTAIGYGALFANNNSNNIAIGVFTPRNFTTGGDGNIFIGNQTAINLASGNSNVIIGGAVTVNAAATTPTVVGNNASNTIILADGAGTQRILVGSTGNVGIGLGNNNIAQNRLELNGGLAGTSGLRFRSYTSASIPVASNGRVLTLNATGDVVLTTDVGSGGSTVITNGTNTTVTGTGVTGTPYRINAQNIYTNDGTLNTTTIPSTTAGVRTVTMGNNNLFFNTLGSTSGNGRIYIGNTTLFPAITATSNYRLLVEGGILSERVKVALRNPTTNWADYVFANDYKLMPLKEVEAYINENKHLPGIDSANELVKNGLDLGDMQAKQMAKIEELTLYVIEQNKTLENQNKALDKQGREIEELKIQVKALLEKK